MSPLSGYDSPTDMVDTSGKYVALIIDSRSRLIHLTCRGPTLDISVRQSLLLLEADEEDGSEGTESAGSDDEDARNPLPALSTAKRSEDDEHNTALVSEGK